jgi:gliding motility-associated-like protein
MYRGDEVVLSTQFGGEPYRSIQWYPATYLSCTNCPEPIFKSNTNGKYQVKITSTYECVDSAQVEINVFYQKRLAIPNVFTPDNDGLNDVFYIIAGTEVVSIRSFQIFNRWGEKVHEARNTKPNDVSSGWRGTYKGQQAPQGTYAYVVELLLDTGSSEIHKGTITLIR